MLVPGLLCSPRLFAEQLPALWRSGPVTVADHRQDDSVAGMARRLLAAAPPRFEIWVAPTRHDDPALRGVVRQMARETGPDAFARQQTAIMNRPDSRPDLAAIRCPTLVVVGAEDGLTTAEHAAEIAETVPGARLVVVADCGHLSTLEQPGAVTAALIDWLDPDS